MQELQAQAALPPSTACSEVCSALDSLGVQHERCALVHGGFLLADVLLREHKAVLLIEGQSCYVRNTGRRRGALSSCKAAQVHERRFVSFLLSR